MASILSLDQHFGYGSESSVWLQYRKEIAKINITQYHHSTSYYVEVPAIATATNGYHLVSHMIDSVGATPVYLSNYCV